MGKNLIQQRRGRGTLRFKAPSFRYAGKAEHPKEVKDGEIGTITDIIHSQGHSAPLLTIEYPSGPALIVAPEGVRVGDSVTFGKDAEIKPGNTLPLRDIPEGTLIYNIESVPGDGGKFVRSSGTAARVLSKIKEKVLVRLPSKKEKEFPFLCRATVGTVAGSGRQEKPFMKAGNMYHRMASRNRMWPSVSANSMNAVDHPFGGKGSHRKGRPTQSGRNYPPGRKVGKIAPKRTGRKKL
jgi:large subunit ribosomal protein L2